MSHQQFADQFLAVIMQTFFRAYFERLQGRTETELIIEHDIEAAYRLVDPNMALTCRRIIKSAVKTADRGVPYDVAHNYLLAKIRTRVRELLAATTATQRKLKTTVLSSITDALD